MLLRLLPLVSLCSKLYPFYLFLLVFCHLLLKYQIIIILIWDRQIDSQMDGRILQGRVTKHKFKAKKPKYKICITNIVVVVVKRAKCCRETFRFVAQKKDNFQGLLLYFHFYFVRFLREVRCCTFSNLKQISNFTQLVFSFPITMLQSSEYQFAFQNVECKIIPSTPSNIHSSLCRWLLFWVSICISSLNKNEYFVFGC